MGDVKYKALMRDYMELADAAAAVLSALREAGAISDWPDLVLNQCCNALGVVLAAVDNFDRHMNSSVKGSMSDPTYEHQIQMVADARAVHKKTEALLRGQRMTERLAR